MPLGRKAIPHINVPSGINGNFPRLQKRIRHCPAGKKSPSRKRPESHGGRIYFFVKNHKKKITIRIVSEDLCPATVGDIKKAILHYMIGQA
jgi:hypothetical protein